MPQAELQSRITSHSPAGKWRVEVWDGKISRGAEGLKVQLHWEGHPPRPDPTPEAQFEMPMYGFKAQDIRNTITWPKGEERCVIHLEGMWDKADITLVTETRRILCETQRPRIVTEPYHEGMLIAGVVVVGLMLGFLLRTWRERADAKAAQLPHDPPIG